MCAPLSDITYSRQDHTMERGARIVEKPRRGERVLVGVKRLSSFKWQSTLKKIRHVLIVSPKMHPCHLGAVNAVNKIERHTHTT